MRELDLDVASEYVAMAAELIYIKSQDAPAAARRGSPRRIPALDLAQRLLEYERFKRSRRDAPRDRHAPRRPLAAARGELPPRAEAPSETLEVSLFDLIETFRRVTQNYRLAHPPALAIHQLRFSVRDKMLELLARLDEKRTMPLLEFSARCTIGRRR